MTVRQCTSVLPRPHLPTSLYVLTFLWRYVYTYNRSVKQSNTRHCLCVHVCVHVMYMSYACHVHVMYMSCAHHVHVLGKIKQHKS